MEITIDTDGTTESLRVLKFENRWKTEEYIRELAAGCYIVKEYFDIAINEIKLQGMINLRKLLQLELSNSRNKLHKRNFMPMMKKKHKNHFNKQWLNGVILQSLVK